MMNTIPDSVRTLLTQKRAVLLAELLEMRARIGQAHADLRLKLTEAEATVTLIEGIDTVLVNNPPVNEPDEYDTAFATTPEPTKAQRSVIRTFDEDPASDEGFEFPSYTVGDEIE